MKLEQTKRCRISLNQIYKKYKQEDINLKSKTVHQKMLNCFKNHEKLLLNHFMIISQLNLRLNTKQFMEKKFQAC